jgi:hypothetical protein
MLDAVPFAEINGASDFSSCLSVLLWDLLAGSF